MAEVKQLPFKHIEDEIIIEESLYLQSKEHQAEIEKLENLIQQNEEEIRSLENIPKNFVFNKDSILKEYEIEQQENLENLEKEFIRKLEGDRIEKRQALNLKMHEILELEEKKELGQEEESEIKALMENLIREKLAVKKEEAEKWLSREKEIFWKELEKTHQIKKQVNKEKLKWLVENEREIWKEERKNIEHRDDFHQIQEDLKALTKEIEVLNEIKSKYTIFEENIHKKKEMIETKEKELNQIEILNSHLKKELEDKYKELSSRNKAKYTNEILQISEKQLENYSQVFFSPYSESLISERSEGLNTGKFRDQSPYENKTNHKKEVDIYVFSPANKTDSEEELDFSLSSEG